MNSPAQGVSCRPHLDPEDMREVEAASMALFAQDEAEWLARLFPNADAETRRAVSDYARTYAAGDHGLGRSRAESPERLKALRAELARRGVDGFLIPRVDEHLSAYMPLRALRLQWLSGYSGSNGVGVVLPDCAAILVDGRYVLQLSLQVESELFNQINSDAVSLPAWLASNLTPGTRLGYDPWLHAPAELDRIAAPCRRVGASLHPLEPNPIDALWREQPPAPLGAAVPHPLVYAGVSSEHKRRELGAALGADAAVISSAESVAWLLNVRGSDVAFIPLPLSRAILYADGKVDWFVDRRKLAQEMPGHLGNDVAICDPESFGVALDALGNNGRSVSISPDTVPAWIHARLRQAGAELIPSPDPCLNAKSCKNAVEIEGARAASRRDGIAICRFLAFMASEAPKGGLTEVDAADCLLAFRRDLPLFRDRSINTISGTGPNGAVIHYRVSSATNRRIELPSLYLVDSGGQFLDGTTDMTRTIAVGTPSNEQRHRFTLVLKGHIALAVLRFPEGTHGVHLDVIARQFLWQEGLDFGHGTGHGVGSYLAVHEGPQRIARPGNLAPLVPGMIVSNEPGYYKPGHYGLRFENLMVVQPDTDLPGAEQPMLRFETLTLAPIDRALIDTSLLTSAEIAWIDAYHAEVRRQLLPDLRGPDAAWLEKETRPLAAI